MRGAVQGKRERCTLYAKSWKIRYDGAGSAVQCRENGSVVRCTLNHGKYGTMVQDARCNAGKTGVLYAKSREIRYDGEGCAVQEGV